MKIPNKIEQLPFEVARQYSAQVLHEYYKRDAALNSTIDCLGELLKEIDGLKRGYIEHGKQISELFGNVEAPCTWPQIGDTIYCFNSRGDVLEQRWCDSKKQNDKRAFLGIFRTLEEAEAYKQTLLSGKM